MSQNYIPQIVIQTKPYITVSAKGISNGLSNTFNDGADFGPDTLLGATSPDQYGPPYTQTAGIQEAWNYAISNALYDEVYNAYTIPEIFLGNGTFNIYQPINFSIGNLPATATYAFILKGLSTNNVIINYYGSGTAMTIDTNINNVELDDFGFNNNNSSQSVDYLIYWNSAKGVFDNILIINHLTLGGNPINHHWAHFNNVFIANIIDLVAPNSGSLYINGTRSNAGYLYLEGQIWTAGVSNTTIGNIYYADVSGYTGNLTINNAMTMLKLSNANGGVTFNAPVNTVLIENTVLVNNPALIVNADIQYMKLLSDTVSGVLIGSTNTTANYTIGVLSIDGLYNVYQHEAFSNASNVKINAYDFRNIPSGTFTSMPTQSTTNGTTAGTVSMNAVEFRAEYKKYVITFSGYENDTTTNQTINFPLPFSSYAVITGNNTGLTVSTTTTGITITAPNSTATFSGIVIVEGY